MTGFYEARHADVRDRFVRDVAEHEMLVFHDNGLYRHLRFQKPGTYILGFDIITWPGSLVIRGDMGTYMFSRLTDMFEFFGEGDINPGYWAEKTPSYGLDQSIKRYSPETFEEMVKEYTRYFIDDYGVSDEEAFWDRIESEVIELGQTEEDARWAIRNFQVDTENIFVDTWEWDLTDYTYHYIWCCFAIVHAIKTYNKETN